MRTGVTKILLYSFGAILSVTAFAKLISSFGHARILEYNDPLLVMPFRYVFWTVGVIELFVASICFSGKDVRTRARLVAWLATGFLIYRLGLLLVAYRRPCSCLGNLTDALHIPPQTADTAMKIILAYLLLGSYATLFWLWRQRRKGVSSALQGSSVVN